ncbi:hypothetical protein INT48_000119 [Thamnidium elegans]|uniref:HTH myb-type domain-containing protein n=1 Tax=Thamnidium elegans TaxID=101142 RepID=A0A8H7VVI9_9FUNG|nr:hypothetical protein INT48_000119 [Thamnidium elegans]
MRPNNPISKEKQNNPAKEIQTNSAKEKQTDTTKQTDTKAELPAKEAQAKSAAQAESAAKEKPKQVHSESASEIKLAEKLHKATEKQEKKAKIKSEKKAMRKTKNNKSKHETETVGPLSSTPAPKVYESASDSDETDKEEQNTKPAPKADPKPTPKADPKPTPKADPKVYESASDSDETDNEIAQPNRKADLKLSPKTERKPKSAAEKNVQKDTAGPEEAVRAEPARTEIAADIEMSDTEEDAMEEDTSAEKSKDQISSNKRKAVDGKVKYRTSDIVSGSESESDSNHANKNDRFNVKKAYKSMEFSLQKTANVEHLKANRISFRKKRDYDDHLTAAENIKGRLNDLFVPSVRENEFISDSESDTDSGEDYETREYTSWQRTLGLKHDKEKDPWPTQRKFGYSDKLKLERRIKKICKVKKKKKKLKYIHILTYYLAKRRPYIRFFQKIAKVFPNMSLHALAKQCKMMYHTKRVSSPWTPEEIAKLKELIEEHGTSPTILSEYMERSPKNISDFMYNHMSTGKINSKRWTPEEDQIIAKAAAKLAPGQSFSAKALVPLFEGTRTPKQIHRRYYSLRHLIKEDGTIEPKRKATLMEELDYLKGLLKQAEDLGLEEESQLDYSKNKGFVASSFYLKSRCTINGFEQMHIKGNYLLFLIVEILDKLIKRQERIIESRRLEKLLGQE